MFAGNTVYGWGGAIFGDLGTPSGTPGAPTIINCRITGNSALATVGKTGGGGGILHSGGPSELTIRNCVIANNVAAGEGGGFAAKDPSGNQSTPVIENCILWGNEAPEGNQIYLDSGIPLTVQYSDVEGGRDDVGGDRTGLDWDTETNLLGVDDDNPDFVDADGPDNDPSTYADNNFRLLSGSPVIDRGNNAQLTSVVTDLDGKVRIIDDPDTPNEGAPAGACAHVDMGAYEFGSGLDCNGNGVEDMCDIAEGTSEDCNADGVPDDEVCQPGPQDIALVASKPVGSEPGSPPRGTLWRSANNIVRLTFACDIQAPGVGEVLIQELLDDGAFGPDLSESFSFTLENPGAGNRVLRINETTVVLTHRKWYTIRNTGGWAGVGDFEVQYAVQVGDATNDGLVLNADVAVINVRLPTFNVEDDAREDIDGNGHIVNADVAITNANIPSFSVAKPSGH